MYPYVIDKISAMSEKKVAVGLVQMTCQEQKEANLDKAESAIRTAASQGAQIVCLQELFASRYFCFEENSAYFDLAEYIPSGPTVQRMQKIAAACKVVLVVSLFEKRTPGLYHNTTVVIDADGSYLGLYRKSHIPDDPGFYEKYYFAPGDTGYRVFDTQYAKIGVLVCWDQWFPEAARLTALQGAEILCYPTAIGWDVTETNDPINQEQYQAWQTIQRSHAIANGVYVVSVNRVGREAGTQFWGGSFVSNPFGSLLYEASHDKEEIQVVSLDIDRIAYYRQTWPFLRDRRIDQFGALQQRFLDISE